MASETRMATSPKGTQATVLLKAKDNRGFSFKKGSQTPSGAWVPQVETKNDKGELVPEGANLPSHLRLALETFKIGSKIVLKDMKKKCESDSCSVCGKDGDFEVVDAIGYSPDGSTISTIIIPVDVRVVSPGLCKI